MNKVRAFIISVLCSTLLFGCQSSGGSKEDTGEFVGTVLGAVLASKAGKNTETKILLAGAGALAGRWLGGRIGRYLDEQDKQKMAAATQEAIATGNSSQWTNPETGVSGSAKVKDVSTSVKQAEVLVLKDKVQEIPPLELDGGVYTVNTGSNLRGGPGTDYKVVDKLSAGSEVDVVGKVEGQPWYMLADAGVAKGFIHSSLVTPTGRLSEITNVASSQPGVEKVQVSTRVTCKTIEQQVTTAEGKSASQTVRACQNSDGSWAIG